MTETARGRFIAFEGGEAVGKSTQAARLARRLDAVLTREPGGTPAGERIRDLLLDASVTGLDARAEALLMAAARADHVAQVVRPALHDGRDVVTDRFIHSSLAYQGYGRGLDLRELERVSVWATDDLWPDVVILIDVPESVAAMRRDQVADRFEREDPAFHRRVVDGFRRLAAADPARWCVVDGSGSIDDVGRLVDEAFDAWVARTGPPVARSGAN